MKKLAKELLDTIGTHLNELKAIPAEQMEKKPAPGKWSKKEIMGHLVDSAQNNIRRFLVTQYEETPFIVYNQDKWVEACGYQQSGTSDILHLWYLLNKQLSVILDNMDESMYKRLCRTQDLHSLDWLAEDYIKHLKHHIHQVLDKENIAYP